MNDPCSCLSCRAQRFVRAVARRVIIGVVATALTGGGLSFGISAVQQAVPSEREVWFDHLLTLAQKADAEYDAIPKSDTQPQSWPELQVLVKEIVYQINEEGASPQGILPADLSFEDFGPGRRSAVAGMYSSETGDIILNDRFLYPAWDGQSWLSTLVHELVHAQGYFVGPSSTLEAQTEIVATEVMASLANLGYPGARADLLDGLRRDALSMAFYIAQFGGSPIHSTYVDAPAVGAPDEAMLARLASVRADVFTPAELSRVEHRLRWWMQHSAEYVGVLARYVVKTTTIEIDAACSVDTTVGEPFQRFPLIGMVQRYRPMRLAPVWGDAETLSPLLVDDLSYVLRDELQIC